MPATQTTIDPLDPFMAGAFVAGTTTPCPLIATRFDITIEAGVALVAMSRSFRNAEPQSIEATITFPVPVHAALFALDMRIGERTVTAQAKRKDRAREDYETALDHGKTAVLHEEVLRGVHMLSVGHIAPETELEVRARWAMTLTNLNGRSWVRIPLTVGDIYGRSGLADSDDLIHGGPLQHGTLKVDCRDGSAHVSGAPQPDGTIAVALNAPIDIEVVGWAPRELYGRAANGEPVTLRVERYAHGDTSFDVAMLLDRSGSMGESYAAAPVDSTVPAFLRPRGNQTKHEAVLAALHGMTSQLRSSDRVDLWQFDTRLQHVGGTPTYAMEQLLGALAGPGGGTEIGGAIDGVLRATTAPDILLITDGKSHALEVQRLARSGRRFSVLLVGADSLEAYVGHLAALTAGEIFVASGNDLSAMLHTAIGALRTPPQRVHVAANEIHQRRGGMQLIARWGVAEAAAEQSIEPRAVAAVVASLLLPTLSTDAAAALAEAEGLVTHLTSLVLVDQEGTVQSAIPATRKVALPTPVSQFNDIMAMTDARLSAEMQCRVRTPSAPPPAARAVRQDNLAAPRLRDWMQSLFRSNHRAAPAQSNADWARLSARINWALAPQELRTGNLSSLDADLAALIRRLADEPIIAEAAKTLGCTPVALVIALLARAAAPQSRAARRIARAVLADPYAERLAAGLTAGLKIKADAAMHA